jgi:hypothetical protein
MYFLGTFASENDAILFILVILMQIKNLDKISQYGM